MAETLISRLHRDSDAITDAIINAIMSDIDTYSALTSDDVELLRTETRVIVRESLDAIGAKRPCSSDLLALFSRQGERRALRRFPMDKFLRAYEVGALTVQRWFWQVATDRDWHEMVAVTTWLATELPRFIDAAMLGYSSARRQAETMGPAGLMAARNLLEGLPVEPLERATGISLAANYLVLICPLPDGVRLTRGDRAALAKQIHTEPGVLMCLAPDGLVVLLPVLDDTTQARATAQTLLGRIAGLSGHPRPGVVAYQPTRPGVARAAAEARELTRLLLAMPDTRTRVYDTHDLLLERTIADDPVLVDSIAKALTPLHGGSGLIETLRSLLANDLDRERTADALHIHRRTLSYRLRRIKELSGLDPRIVRDLYLLRNALIASDLRRQRQFTPTPA